MGDMTGLGDNNQKPIDVGDHEKTMNAGLNQSGR